jgi:predicted TIM-barrel fold metal-dependent hydrolase
MRCDSHVHIIGPLAQYPQHQARAYLAGIAELGTLRRLGKTRNIERFVIVQPSFYGSDNTLLLEGLDALGELGRGVAVVDANHSDTAVLEDWERRGVRGLRVNLYSALGTPKPFDSEFSAMVKIAQPLGWHVEVIAPLRVVIDQAALIAQSPAPVVIDHYGVYGEATPNGAEGRQLLALLEQPHVWMKLSAPYRVGNDSLATRPDRPWLKAILDRAGNRCVWGSDWPHTPPHEEQEGGDIEAPYRKISYTALVDDFLAALGDSDLATSIMENNPARLYGYPAMRPA